MANPNQPTISVGAQGDAVKRLQRGLRRTPDPSVVVDGVFGPQTEAKVKDFQSGSGLTADGVVGPQTWAALPEARSQRLEIAPSAVDKDQRVAHLDDERRIHDVLRASLFQNRTISSAGSGKSAPSQSAENWVLRLQPRTRPTAFGAPLSPGDGRARSAAALTSRHTIGHQSL